jgi:hypothetical protein
MKHLRVSFVVIASLIVTGTAFTLNSKKPTASVIYYYDENVGLTRGAINPGSQVLIQSEVKTKSNWIASAQTGGSGAYLNAIMFDQEPGDVSDGIADGQYSLQEAIDAVWSEYTRMLQFDLPTHGNSFTPATSGASAITIGRSPTN